MKISDNWTAYVEVKIESAIWDARREQIRYHTRMWIEHEMKFPCEARMSFSELEYRIAIMLFRLKSVQDLDRDEKIVYIDLMKKIFKEISAEYGEKL